MSDTPATKRQRTASAASPETVRSKICLRFLLAAIVRLGRKYDSDRLLAAAVARLTATLPRALTERDSNRYSPAPGRRIAYDPALLFDTINLAIRNGLPALLPTLYFDVLPISEETDGLQTVLTGLHRADGTSATLSLESQMTLISSRMRVTSAQAKHMFGWLNSTPPVSLSTDASMHGIFWLVQSSPPCTILERRTSGGGITTFVLNVAKLLRPTRLGPSASGICCPSCLVFCSLGRSRK
ncbi:hypothetical protein C8R47DRAFT_1092927 [Mycena vitilis]|nr:hypothetical protein C8R47DRAFT_1092927 [Mycena vitilis]